MSELAKEKLYRKELIKAGATGDNNVARIRSLQNGGGGDSSAKLETTRTNRRKKSFEFVQFDWGMTFSGNCVWTDGKNIYLSDTNVGDFVLDKKNKRWIPTTWNINEIHGYNVWTDGENIYYSESGDHYVLNKATSTWETKVWNGLDNIHYGFDGYNVWTDGTNIYYSYENDNLVDHYVLDKATSTWSVKTWSGLTNFRAQTIWTDGDYIWNSIGSNHYMLDKLDNSTWLQSGDFSGNDFYGSTVWTDGEDIYAIINNAVNGMYGTGTKKWGNAWYDGFASFLVNGHFVWTDGEDIYLNTLEGESYKIVITKGMTIRL